MTEKKFELFSLVLMCFVGINSLIGLLYQNVLENSTVVYYSCILNGFLFIIISIGYCYMYERRISIYCSIMGMVLFLLSMFIGN